MTPLGRKRRNLRNGLRNKRGAAGVEIAFWLVLTIVPLLSAADLAFYIYQRMQVEMAAQAGAAAAWTLCDTAQEQPAVQKCNTGGALATAINAAVGSTSLGNSVTLASGYPIEGYYCVNGSGTLVSAGATATLGGTPVKPADCTAAVGNTSKPGDYLQVSATYTYTPVFTAVPITALLPAQITRTAWMRMS